MKKVIILAAFMLMLSGRHVFATQPVSIVAGLPESRYNITNATVTISSSTVLTISATNPTTLYRQITLTAPTSFYYRVDGSTNNIATVGYPGLANTDVVIESNQAISILSPVGVASSAARYIEKVK